jgi:hypothetical protein
MIMMALLHLAGLENSECIWKIQRKPEVLFSKDMANYAIFILVPIIYNPILNIKAVMSMKRYTNYW